MMDLTVCGGHSAPKRTRSISWRSLQHAADGFEELNAVWRRELSAAARKRSGIADGAHSQEPEPAQRVSTRDGHFHKLNSFVLDIGAGTLQCAAFGWAVNCKDHEMVPSEFGR